MNGTGGQGRIAAYQRVLVLLAEVALIVLGVLLGLWLDERQEDLELADFVERSRAVILAELADNVTRIEAARAYHLELLPALVQARDATRQGETVQSVSGYRGFGPPPVTRAAYETALSAATFARIDPQEAASIAYAYEQVAAVSDTINRYKLALAGGNREFYSLMSAAFADALYAEDAALAAIAALVESTVPPAWFTVIDVQPY